MDQQMLYQAILETSIQLRHLVDEVENQSTSIIQFRSIQDSFSSELKNAADQVKDLNRQFFALALEHNRVTNELQQIMSYVHNLSETIASSQRIFYNTAKLATSD